MTNAERRVHAAVLAGHAIDLGGEDVADGASWGPDYTIGADLLAELLATAPQVGQQLSALCLAGARVTGRLDLGGMVLHRALDLRRCYFDEGMFLDEARASRIALEGCHLPRFSGRQLDMSGNLLLERLTGTRQVILIGAHVGGFLMLRRSELADAHTPGVFIGDNLDVTLGMRCSGLRAHGEMRLLGARIGGELSFEGARLRNDGGIALNADGLQVDGPMFCTSDAQGERFECSGQIRLVAAHLHEASFNGALLHDDEATIRGDGLRVDYNLTFTGDQHDNSFESIGEVRIVAVTVGGQLTFSGAHLTRTNGLALDVERMRAVDLFLPARSAVKGIVDLTYANVGRYHDGGWTISSAETDERNGVRLSGFVYESLGPASSSCEDRLEWLRRSEDGYVPQGYDQLAEVYRRAGRDEDAKTVGIAKQRRRRDQMHLLPKLGSYVLDGAVGYGYRTSRAALALLAIVLIGVVVFDAAFPEHMGPVKPIEQRPVFHALLYSVDAVLPVIDLGQERTWSPNGWAQAWYAFSALAGWLLGLGLVAYVTARFFRE